MLGYHASVSSSTLQEDLDLLSKSYSVTQIFLGSPKTYKVPNISSFKVPIKIIVHASFLPNLLRDDIEQLTVSMSYLVKLSSLCSSIGVKYIVVHTGAISQDQSYERGVQILRDFCLDWIQATSNHNTVLCLENAPGSKKGTKIGSLTLLYKLVSQLNHPRIRIAYDTEHGFANGFLPNLRQIDFLLSSGYVSVIHLNSFPQDVKFGHHLDRHCATTIIDGQYPELLKMVYQVAKEYSIPCILERDSSLVSKDVEYLEGGCLNAK